MPAKTEIDNRRASLQSFSDHFPVIAFFNTHSILRQLSGLPRSVPAGQTVGMRQKSARIFLRAGFVPLREFFSPAVQYWKRERHLPIGPNRSG